MKKTVFVKNYSQLKKLMGMGESSIYRNTVEIIEALQEYVDKGGKLETCLIGYKCKPKCFEGDVIFDFVEETPDGIYFEFTTTAS